MLSVRATPNQEMCNVKKRQNSGLISPEGFACPTPSMGPIIAGRGLVILGLLAHRNGSRTGNEQKQLHGVIAPIATPSDYLDIVVDDVVSLRGSLKNALPRSPRKSFNLVEFSPGV